MPCSLLSAISISVTDDIRYRCRFSYISIYTAPLRRICTKNAHRAGPPRPMGIYTDDERRKKTETVSKISNINRLEVTVPCAPAEVPSIETLAEKRRTECYAYQIYEVTRCYAPADMKKYSGYFGCMQLQFSGKAVSIQISTESPHLIHEKKCDRYRIDRMLCLVGPVGFEPTTKGL